MEELRLRALELAMQSPSTPSAITNIARQTSPDAASWAFTQRELRRLAAAKFEHASEMLFDRTALEQATVSPIAQYHASRFRAGALVADLTTGIGADLLALASRGPAVGFEVDDEISEYARHNLRALNLQAEVRVENCLNAEWTFPYAFADPARRIRGRRTLDPEEFSPNPIELALRMKSLRLGGIKLSPVLSDIFLTSMGEELEFVSYGGECREALVWMGTEAKSGRTAVMIKAGGTQVAAHRLTSGSPPETTLRNGAYIFEADPAAIRAHCLGALCDAHGLVALADSNGYLTGDTLIVSPWLVAFEVLAPATGNLKALRAQLKSLDAGRVEVKTRARGLDIPRLNTMLRGNGERLLYILAYPAGKGVRYVVTQRIA